jgi:hypothetical protein
VVKGAASAWLRYLFIARNKAWGPHALSQGLREYRGSFRTRVAKFLAQSGSGTGIAGSDFAYETIIHDHFFNSE